DYGIEPKSENGTTGEIANRIGNYAKGFAESITSELAAAAVPLVLGLVIASFVIYYGFAEGETFYAKLRHVIPLPDDIEESLFRDIRRVTNVVFIGNILVSVLGGVVGALSFVIFGVPNAVFWGFIMIILGILPLVGAPIIWGPTAAYLFVQGNVVGAVGILIINGGIVIGYVDNILRPKLIGKAANVHPVLVLIGILGGLEAFGALGFVIGPLVLAVFIALIRSYTEWHPRWKERRARGDEKYMPGANIEIVPSAKPPPQEETPPPPPSDEPERK
ncbi:MAG TPA: AI-2E family transporter, partial [Candidatus Thermoplasmatota archaeon]|nr:AI-2E family transporter [Candidatus Thermoplasmatota archaeon]